MNLIIVTDSDKKNDLFLLNDYRAKHIIEILRSNAGDFIEIGILNGPQGQAEIVKINDSEVHLRPHKLTEVPLPIPKISLICALPRPQTLKKVLITSAMMGVENIYLIRANRVEKSFFQSPLLQENSFNQFLIEGLSQGKNTRLPNVTIHDRFKRFFENEFPIILNKYPEEPILLLSDKESSQNLSKFYSNNTSLLVAIGPEGGWVPFELEFMESHGFQQFTLGRWVLRVETAVAGLLNQIELLKMISR